MRPITLLRVTLALNVVVTIGAMMLAYRALRHADDSGRLVVRSHRVLQAAEETLRRAVDAETGTRGGGDIDASMRDAANVNMAALRDTIRGIRQSETDLLDARIRIDDAAGGRVKRLSIAMTGLATALLTLIVGLLVFVARPGVWRG